MGILVTTILDRLLVFEGAEGLSTQELRDTGVDELNFKDTTGAVDILGLGGITGEGETTMEIMVEVVVDISPIPSHDIDITKIKGTPIPG